MDKDTHARVRAHLIIIGKRKNKDVLGHLPIAHVGFWRVERTVQNKNVCIHRRANATNESLDEHAVCDHDYSSQ